MPWGRAVGPCSRHRRRPRASGACTVLYSTRSGCTHALGAEASMGRCRMMGLWRAALGWHGACRSPLRQGLSSARAVQSLQEHSYVPADPQDGEQCARGNITQLRPPSQGTGLPAVHIPVVAGGGGRAAASAGRAGLRPLHRGVWPCRASMLLCAAVCCYDMDHKCPGTHGSAWELE